MSPNAKCKINVLGVACIEGTAEKKKVILTLEIDILNLF
jgi:hypothetical protein